jgi:hypothetical protein
MPHLLTKKSINKYCELQNVYKRYNNAYHNPAEKEKTTSINHTATMSIDYTTDDHLSAQLYLPLVCPLLYNRNQSADALRV